MDVDQESNFSSKLSSKRDSKMSEKMPSQPSVSHFVNPEQERYRKMSKGYSKLEKKFFNKKVSFISFL